MSDFQTNAKKSIAVLLVLVFMNSIFLIFSPQVYTDLLAFVPVALLSTVICVDVAIRSISTQSDRYSRTMVGLAFLSFPFMVALPYYGRNPQYLGFLLLFAGYSFSLGSLIVKIVTVLGLFMIFRSSLLLEEKLLLETFGEEYEHYLRRTKRLLP